MGIRKEHTIDEVKEASRVVFNIEYAAAKKGLYNTDILTGYEASKEDIRAWDETEEYLSFNATLQAEFQGYIQKWDGKELQKGHDTYLTEESDAYIYSDFATSTGKEKIYTDKKG